MAQNRCLPDSIYGPYKQTLFLGCSVLGFTASAGWNGQNSEITIELVEDPCPGNKEYWATTVVLPAKAIHVGADPGFTNPEIGAPAYFRIQDFEYAGIIQSWTKKHGPDGNPRYTVKLVDPRVILDNCQVILDSYEHVQGGIYNLFNVFGYLEFVGMDCNDKTVNNVGVGAPATGFGTSQRTDRGLPWTLIKKALQDLTGSKIGAPYNNFKTINDDRYGIEYSKGGIFYIDDSGNGWGELGFPNLGNANTSRYILDISELPTPKINTGNNDYRIMGPVVSISELINQVCADAGHDYYVELLPVKQGPVLVIKVRTVSRTNAVALGEINKFVNAFDFNGGADGRGIINDAIGRELRPDINSSFLIGAPTRQYYEENVVYEEYNYEKTSSGGEQPPGPPVERTNPYNITPFWGYDAVGKLIQSRDNVRAGVVEAQGWEARLDFRKINLALVYPINLGLESNAYGWVGENELRWALGDMSSFEFMILRKDYPNTVLKLYWKETLAVELEDVDPWTVPDGTRPSFTVDTKPGSDAGNGNPAEAKNRDRKTMFNWLSSYASDIYGRKFLVQAPYLCSTTKPDATADSVPPINTSFTDLPSTEGAWASELQDDGYTFSEDCNVLGIPNQSREADFFKDDVGKFQPILKYSATGLNTESLGIDDYLAQKNCVFEAPPSPACPGESDPINTCVWVKAEVEPQWVQGCPVSGVDGGWVGSTWTDGETWSALMTIPGPVQTGSITWPFSAKLQNTSNIGMNDANPDFITAQRNMGFSHESVGRMAAPAAWPTGAGLPLVSTTRTYGPWWSIGANPGGVHCEVDEGLAPWEYGSIAALNKGARAKIVDSVTDMQVSERGEVTVPGYPEIMLGAALVAVPPNFLFANRNLQGQVHAWPRGAAPYDTVNMVGPNAPPAGANVGSINVNWSAQGVTTSYTISTFTPVFGRFSKGNADRLKQIGLNRQRATRERRAERALKRLIKVAESRASVARNTETSPGVNADNSPTMLFAGKLIEDKKRKVVIGATKNTFPNYADYDNTAMMTMDGFFRPVSITGGGPSGLPRINTTSGVCEPQPTQAAGPPAPVSGYTGLPILPRYLDFLADPTHNKGLFEGPRTDGSTSGHDVEGVARETIQWLRDRQPENSNSMLFYRSGLSDEGPTTYASDYRYMAMRGPMVMHGWGYDLHGKPIPNVADTGACSGIFESSGLQDKFKENWLSDACDWPVAPIDLRFDRKRGVWTSPPAFRLYQVENSGQPIATGSSGPVQVIKHKTDLYDAEGNLISDPIIEAENWTKCSIPSGTKGLAYYDTADCKYWMIPEPIVRASGSGTCGRDSVPEESVCGFIFGTGLKLNIENHTGVVNSNIKISSTGCGLSGIEPTPFEHLVFSTGLTVGEATGVVGSGCSYTITGPKISSTGCSGVANGLASAPFEELIFSTGLAVATGSGCSYTITGPKIGSTGCQRDVQDNSLGIFPTTFDSLIFASGLTLESGSPFGSGECSYTLTGPKLRSHPCHLENALEASGWTGLTFSTGLTLKHNIDIEEGYGYKRAECDFVVVGPSIGSTGCSGDIAAQPFNSLVFSTGLIFETGSCQHTLSGPRISALNCFGYAGVPNSLNPTSFRDLQISTGLSLRQEDDDCTFTMRGPKIGTRTAGSPIVDSKDFNFDVLLVSGDLQLNRVSMVGGDSGCIAVISSSGSGSSPRMRIGSTGCGTGTVCTTTDCLVFGSGLALSVGEGASHIVSGPNIGVADNCYEDTFIPDDLPRPFNTLAFGSGLSLEETGLCDFVLRGPKIAQTGECVFGNVEVSHFNKLLFSTGLALQSRESGCSYEITGPRISATGCETPGTPSLYSFDAKPFSLLEFSSGIWVDSGVIRDGSRVSGDCSFTIRGPTLTASGCDTSSDRPVAAHWENLNIGTGLSLTQVGDEGCNYTITGPTISSDECGCSYLEPAPFQDLSFGTGLVVESTGNCGYLVRGPTWFNSNTYLCSEGEEVPAEGKSFCNFETKRGIDLRSSVGCSGTGLLAINYTQSIENSELCDCPSDAEACERYSLGSAGIPSLITSTQTVELGVGLHKIVDYKKNGECRTVVGKVLTVGPENSADPFNFGPYITGIKLISDPCQMIVAEKGSTCGEEGAYSTVKLGTHGIDLEIPVVTGVCCSGDTLQVNFQKLTFCSGLLKAIEPTGGPVCPE